MALKSTSEKGTNTEPSSSNNTEATSNQQESNLNSQVVNYLTIQLVPSALQQVTSSTEEVSSTNEENLVNAQEDLETANFQGDQLTASSYELSSDWQNLNPNDEIVDLNKPIKNTEIKLGTKNAVKNELIEASTTNKVLDSDHQPIDSTKKRTKLHQRKRIEANVCKTNISTESKLKDKIHKVISRKRCSTEEFSSHQQLLNSSTEEYQACPSKKRVEANINKINIFTKAKSEDKENEITKTRLTSGTLSSCDKLLDLNMEEFEVSPSREIAEKEEEKISNTIFNTQNKTEDKVNEIESSEILHLGEHEDDINMKKLDNIDSSTEEFQVSPSQRRLEANINKMNIFTNTKAEDKVNEIIERTSINSGISNSCGKILDLNVIELEVSPSMESTEPEEKISNVCFIAQSKSEDKVNERESSELIHNKSLHLNQNEVDLNMKNLQVSEEFSSHQTLFDSSTEEFQVSPNKRRLEANINKMNIFTNSKAEDKVNEIIERTSINSGISNSCSKLLDLNVEEVEVSPSRESVEPEEKISNTNFNTQSKQEEKVNKRESRELISNELLDHKMSSSKESAGSEEKISNIIFITQSKSEDKVNERESSELIHNKSLHLNQNEVDLNMKNLQVSEEFSSHQTLFDSNTEEFKVSPNKRRLEANINQMNIFTNTKAEDKVNEIIERTSINSGISKSCGKLLDLNVEEVEVSPSRESTEQEEKISNTSFNTQCKQEDKVNERESMDLISNKLLDHKMSSSKESAGSEEKISNIIFITQSKSEDKVNERESSELIHNKSLHLNQNEVDLNMKNLMNIFTNTKAEDKVNEIIERTSINSGISNSCGKLLDLNVEEVEVSPSRESTEPEEKISNTSFNTQCKQEDKVNERESIDLISNKLLDHKMSSSKESAGSEEKISNIIFITQSKSEDKVNERESSELIHNKSLHLNQNEVDLNMKNLQVSEEFSSHQTLFDSNTEEFKVSPNKRRLEANINQMNIFTNTKAEDKVNEIIERTSINSGISNYCGKLLDLNVEEVEISPSRESTEPEEKISNTSFNTQCKQEDKVNERESIDLISNKLLDHKMSSSKESAGSEEKISNIIFITQSKSEDKVNERESSELIHNKSLHLNQNEVDLNVKNLQVSEEFSSHQTLFDSNTEEFKVSPNKRRLEANINQMNIFTNTKAEDKVNEIIERTSINSGISNSCGKLLDLNVEEVEVSPSRESTEPEEKISNTSFNTQCKQEDKVNERECIDLISNELLDHKISSSNESAGSVEKASKTVISTEIKPEKQVNEKERGKILSNETLNLEQQGVNSIMKGFQVRMNKKRTEPEEKVNENVSTNQLSNENPVSFQQLLNSFREKCGVKQNTETLESKEKIKISNVSITTGRMQENKVNEKVSRNVISNEVLSTDQLKIDRNIANLHVSPSKEREEPKGKRNKIFIRAESMQKPVNEKHSGRIIINEALHSDQKEDLLSKKDLQVTQNKKEAEPEDRLDEKASRYQISNEGSGSNNMNAILINSQRVYNRKQDRVCAKYKITYYNIHGLGEGLRYLLTYIEEPFEDFHPYNHNNRPDVDFRDGFGHLLEMRVDYRLASEYIASARYIGKQANVAGKDAFENSQIDIIAEVLLDCYKEISAFLSDVPPTNIRDKWKVEFMTRIPNVLQSLEDNAKQCKGFLATEQISWVDFIFAGFSEFLTDICSGRDIVQEYETLNDIRTKIYQLDTIARYRQSCLKTGM